MEPWLATTVLFSILIIGLVLGLPIAFVLGGIGVIFTFLLWGPDALIMVTSFIHTQGSSFVLIAVPLFILMANFLEVSGIADDLFDAMYHWVGNIPGGLRFHYIEGRQQSFHGRQQAGPDGGIST